MLNDIKDFIAKFKLELSSLKKEEKKPGKAFNLDNIRVVLICGWRVPNYMSKYSPDFELRQNKRAIEEGGKDGPRKLNAFFTNNQEIKEDNFFILNVDELKKLYGPTFQLVWESILNEPFESTTTSSTVNKN